MALILLNIREIVSFVYLFFISNVLSGAEWALGVLIKNIMVLKYVFCRYCYNSCNSVHKFL